MDRQGKAPQRSKETEQRQGREHPPPLRRSAGPRSTRGWRRAFAGGPTERHCGASGPTLETAPDVRSNVTHAADAPTHPGWAVSAFASSDLGDPIGLLDARSRTSPPRTSPSKVSGQRWPGVCGSERAR